MPRPYRPLAFGNRFIEKAFGAGVEHMKLQKLTYISYGWWLAFEDDPIIHEQPQVWKLGPVFNSMYFSLRQHGSQSINAVQRDLPLQPAPKVDFDDDSVLDLIDWVWDRYNHLNSYELSDLTHKPNSPWYKTAAEHSFSVPRNFPIPVQIIKNHYRRLAAENDLK